MKRNENARRLLRTAWSTVWTSVAITVAAAALALIVNGVRPKGIPLFATHDYEILVPCPQYTDTAAEITVSTAARLLSGTGVVFVDARERELYDRCHIVGAVSLPHDPLAPVTQQQLERFQHARWVVAYGGKVVGEYCQGRELANELKSLARKLECGNVGSYHVLLRGFPAWRQARQPVEGPQCGVNDR